MNWQRSSLWTLVPFAVLNLSCLATRSGDDVGQPPHPRRFQILYVESVTGDLPGMINRPDSDSKNYPDQIRNRLKNRLSGEGFQVVPDAKVADAAIRVRIHSQTGFASGWAKILNIVSLQLIPVNSRIDAITVETDVIPRKGNAIKTIETMEVRLTLWLFFFPFLMFAPYDQAYVAGISNLATRAVSVASDASRPIPSSFSKRVILKNGKSYYYVAISDDSHSDVHLRLFNGSNATVRREEIQSIDDL